MQANRTAIAASLCLLLVGACTPSASGSGEQTAARARPDAEGPDPSGRDPVDHQIESLRTRAELLFESRRSEALLESAGLFERVVELDPSDAKARAGLASVLSLLALYSIVPPSDALAAAAEAAEAAVALAPEMAAPYAALGLSEFLYRWRWQLAEENFRHAIELDPSDPTVHHWYGMLLSSRGRFEEAVVEMDRALELAPRSRIINVKRATVLARAGRLEDAQAQLRRAIELFPEMALPWRELGFVHLRRGDPEAAGEAFERAAELAGGASKSVGGLAFAYAVTGRDDEARRILTDFVERSQDEYVPPMYVALMYAGLDEPEEAVKWLLEAERVRDPGLVYLAVKPGFESLQGLEEFDHLLGRLDQR